MNEVTKRIAVLCRQAGGSPDIIVYLVTGSQDQHDLGEFYDRAEKAAAEDGYESPMSSFDEAEPAFMRLNSATKVDTVRLVKV